jgi:hypothetical protein
MEGTRLGFIAAIALVAGVGGCSLPQVLPLEGTTSAGPSPYGVWYEQHWATNSVLLAAADQPAEDVEITDSEVSISVDPDAEVDVDVDATLGTEASEFEEAAAEAQRAAEEADAAFEASSAPKAQADVATDTAVEEFDETSPYQFPASSFAPAQKDAPPPAEGPIRY